METLPRHEEAVIPLRKFMEYALDATKQPDKATAFERALGYNKDNAEKLVDNIREHLKDFPVTDKGNKGFGQIYEVAMELIGANGKTAKVLTG